jgi:predicted RNA-binding protein with PUA-like domain
MNYWLLKSEPSTFSIDDLAAAPGKRTCWDGVRNYQARNFMRDGMRRGDRAFFYHSSCPQPGVAGIVRVARAGYPDHTQFEPKSPYYDPDSDPSEPRWYMVDVALQKKFKRVITLTELRKHAADALSGLALLSRGNRLSVMPVSEEHWQFICSLS